MFEELDYRVTPLGALSLRRRRDLSGGDDIYEIILGDEYLMSSRFTAAEIALAKIGLGRCADGPLDVVVGGLGLGYTAKAVLEHEGVRSLQVVDTMAEVIDWHRTGLLPLGKDLAADPRCSFVHGDFFTLAMSEAGFDPRRPGHQVDAILLDIDHSPTKLLHPDHATFYAPEGLARTRRRLRPHGVFALWSNDPPDPEFITRLERDFREVQAETVSFAGLSGRAGESNTVYSALAG
ncbi:MAG TPA: spermidine synthase [Devosiaceae bacterium]|jgi:spermidine synthase|nr:spermidine synthase [Devosiaceae bacterium]